MTTEEEAAKNGKRKHKWMFGLVGKEQNRKKKKETDLLGSSDFETLLRDLKPTLGPVNALTIKTRQEIHGDVLQQQQQRPIQKKKKERAQERKKKEEGKRRTKKEECN